MEETIFRNYKKRCREAELLKVKIKDMEKGSEKRRVLKEKLNEINKKIKKEENIINNFIENIDDCIIKKVMLFRYRDGLKWEEVAANMGSFYHKDTLRIMTQRYIKKNFT